MDTPTVWRLVAVPFGLWCVMAVLAVVNGGIRETYLLPALGYDRAHLLSTALLVGAILLVTGLYFTQTAAPYTRLELLAIGVAWAVLTVGFEFLVGYLEGTPVSVTLGQYNVLAGEVWIVVPLTLVFSPIVFGRLLNG
ncbi:MAG: hypothetical protein U5K37_06160 [Natrialbaceae archaeon]|nr:hypothetical protein [Natrialbaceae archaeon]